MTVTKLSEEIPRDDKGDELKYYGIEYKLEKRANVKPDDEVRYTGYWRYFSLYNGARGRWWEAEAWAIEEGEAHKALIIALHKPMSNPFTVQNMPDQPEGPGTAYRV